MFTINAKKITIVSLTREEATNPRIKLMQPYLKISNCFAKKVVFRIDFQLMMLQNVGLHMGELAKKELSVPWLCVTAPGQNNMSLQLSILKYKNFP